jgi:uncharacterized membrane protein
VGFYASRPGVRRLPLRRHFPQYPRMLNALIPNHPGFVHFPIGLLAAAFLFEALALAARRPALHDVGRACLFLGTVAAMVTVGTGIWGEKLVDPRPHELDQLIDRHETLAFLTLSLAIVLSMWRISMRKKYEGQKRLVFVALLGVLAVLVLLTGHIGGRMVYDHGAAVTVGKRTFGSPGLPK